MDPATLKVLLDSQNQGFRSALDVLVDQFTSRINAAESRMTDLQRSLEFTQAEVDDLKGELVTLKRSDREKETVIENLRARVEELVQRTNYQEDYSRRNNLRISGIMEPVNGETWEQTAKQVSTLCEEKLQLPPIKLERAHRVGQFGRPQPRTVIARFEKFSDREAVMRNAKKLKGTGIYINEDLCPASQELVRNQLPALKQARSEGKIAFFRHTRLVVKERTSHHSPTTGGAPSGDVASGLVPTTPASGTSVNGESSRGAGHVPPGTPGAAIGASAGAGALVCDGDGPCDKTQSNVGTAIGRKPTQAVATTGADVVTDTPPSQEKPKKELRERNRRK